MENKMWVWAAAALALLVVTGGAGGAATLSVEPSEGPITTPIVATGTGYNPGQPVDIVWSTMVGNRVSGSGFEEARWTVGTTTADPSGNVHFEFAAPSDLGGPPHPVLAMDGDTVLATTAFTVTRTAQISPTSGPLGATIELHLTGGGWTQYDNIVAVTYDNAYIGYMCSFNSQGNMTTWIKASGGVGLHSIDVWPALYYGPSGGPAPWKLPHLSMNDQPWMPPMFHFEFMITDMNGSVPLEVQAPPVTPADEAPAAVYVAAAGLLLVAAAMEVPIRQRGRVRAPAAAAVAAMLFAAFGAMAAPAAADGGTSDTPIEFMATGTDPAVLLDRGTTTPGAPVQVSGVRMPASTEVEITWSTYEVHNKINGEKFLGWPAEPAVWTLRKVMTDANGAFAFELSTPYDFQGLHDIGVKVGDQTLASSAIIVEPRFEIVGPTQVRAGEKVTVQGYGLGFEQYSAIWNVAYDNRLTGWTSGIESHGNTSFFLYAVGEPGQHFIDIGEGAVGYPYMNLWESPFQNRPPAHLVFVIVGTDGTVPPPEAPASASGGIGFWGPVALTGVAGALLGAQAVRMWSAPRSGGTGSLRKPSD
jgi:hypothetical protein